MKNRVKSASWNRKADHHTRCFGFFGGSGQRFLKNALQDTEKTEKKEGAIE